MDINLNLTSHQLVAAISTEVAGRNDPNSVFDVTRNVLREYNSVQSRGLAKLLYEASREDGAAKKNKAFDLGFTRLEKRRNAVLEAVNLSLAVQGHGKYARGDLGVYSAPMRVLEGSSIWQSYNSPKEVVQFLMHDSEQKELLLAWGRTLAHGDEARAAAAGMSGLVRAAHKRSLLAIGAAVQRKGGEVVPFEEGVAVSWAAEAYQALEDSTAKDGLVLRGVNDAILAAIGSAFYADRFAKFDHPTAYVVEGQSAAFHLVNPDKVDGRRSRIEVRQDANAGQEDYAGADDIVLQFNNRRYNLGNNPTEIEVRETQAAIRESYEQEAEALLADAEAMFGYLSCGVKENKVIYDTFPALKDAVFERQEANSAQRLEVKNASKELELALVAVEAAERMDAVSRRTFLAAMQHLPLEEAINALATKRKAEADRKARAEAQVAEAMAEAEREAKREAEYEAAAKREADHKEKAAERKAMSAVHARNEAKLEAELAEARLNAKERI